MCCSGKRGCGERGEERGERRRESRSTRPGPGVQRSRLGFWLQPSLLELSPLGASQTAALTSRGGCEGSRQGCVGRRLVNSMNSATAGISMHLGFNMFRHQGMLTLQCSLEHQLHKSWAGRSGLSLLWPRCHESGPMNIHGASEVLAMSTPLRSKNGHAKGRAGYGRRYSSGSSTFIIISLNCRWKP